MKFEIRRASWLYDVQRPSPCDGAVLDAASKQWIIEIASLDALLALSESVGNDLIVSAVPEVGLPHIYIYDDYME